MTTTVTAAPYDAAQCPECHEWVYLADGPFAEGGDRTKPMADFEHWMERHAEPGDDAKPVLSIPWFHTNAHPVEAIRPERKAS